VRYSFIKRQKKAFPADRLCRLLKVSRSGYYDYLERGDSCKPSEEMALITRAREIHRINKGVYGSRRLAQALQAIGYQVGRYRARTLMQRAGITARRTKQFKVTTNSRHKYPVAPNLLNRQFDVDCPNRVWASDITYLWTKEGWLYLAAVMDLYSRKIVGWSVSNRINADLPLGALKMALGGRRPEFGLIHHSDQGVQYACDSYQQLLRTNGLMPSMSRKGNCWDNAVMESFFSTLKTELTHHRRYETRQETYRDLFDYIEIFYNRRRLHSYLGYTSPESFEKGGIAA